MTTYIYVLSRNFVQVDARTDKEARRRGRRAFMAMMPSAFKSPRRKRPPETQFGDGK